MSTPTANKPSTRKRMLVMIGLVLLLILGIAGVKALLLYRMFSNMKPPPPATVSAGRAEYQEWQPTLDAVGSLRAVRGADLALDVSGLVTKVDLQSGDDVKEGQVLLELRADEDVAKLHELEATAALAEVTFRRMKQQLAVKAIPQATYDSAEADLKAKQADVQQQQVVVARKQLRAPFAGRAGIVSVNPGAFLDSGKTIVTVQQLDPLYVDFYLPQRNLGQLQVGQSVALALDAYPKKTFEGTVSAISPKVDPATRNVQVEAKVANPDRQLAPGMFAKVSVDVGSKQRYLTLPQTAVVFNPYGETVFVVEKKSEFDRAKAAKNAGKPGEESGKNPGANAGAEKNSGNQPAPPPDTLVVEQRFVTTNGTRGDQIAVVSGIEEGDEVVTSGQLKLKNGAPVKVDNSVKPADSANPQPQESN
jgi:membrane fusion protein (multidrug efflux system)